MLPVAEIELEDAWGTVFPLEWPDRHLTEITGLGLPPVVHWTTRSPFQHGRTHWSYTVQPRVVNIGLFMRGCGRLGYWQARAAAATMLNPENGPHKLRLTYPDGETFELHDGWVNGDFGLSSQQATYSTQAGALQMVFYSPFWKWITSPLAAGQTRDDEGRTCVETSTIAAVAQLALPFVGPFLLGTTAGTATLAATNGGGAAVKPVISLEGPAEDWTLTNPANGHQLTWDGYAIAAGEVVTIDVPAKTITNGAGTDLSAYAQGNTGTFALQPGANALAFYGAGGVVNGVTTLSVCWYVEVIGV
jgi:hypothetical protein